MLDWQKGCAVFECDSCSAVLMTEEHKIMDVRATLRKEGWASVRGGNNEWEHYCPSCIKSAVRK